MAKQSASKWSTRDLMVTIVIGLAFGVLLIPVTYAYAALLSLGILARSLLGGVATVGACLCVPCVAAELHTGATHRGAWVSVR